MAGGSDIGSPVWAPVTSFTTMSTVTVTVTVTRSSTRSHRQGPAFRGGGESGNGLDGLAELGTSLLPVFDGLVKAGAVRGEDVGEGGGMVNAAPLGCVGGVVHNHALSTETGVWCLELVSLELHRGWGR